MAEWQKSKNEGANTEEANAKLDEDQGKALVFGGKLLEMCVSMATAEWSSNETNRDTNKVEFELISELAVAKKWTLTDLCSANKTERNAILRESFVLLC